MSEESKLLPSSIHLQSHPNASDGDCQVQTSEKTNGPLQKMRTRAPHLDQGQYGAPVRGNGFYDWMVKKPLDSIVDAMSSLSVADTDTATTCRPLPVVNFLDWNRYSHGRSSTT